MKDVGTEWWMEPRLAGYADSGRVWDADICRIIKNDIDWGSKLPPGTPLRDYIVRFDGGHQLFANDACLFKINAERTGGIGVPEVFRTPEAIEEERLKKEDSLRRMQREFKKGLGTVG